MEHQQIPDRWCVRFCGIGMSHCSMGHHFLSLNSRHKGAIVDWWSSTKGPLHLRSRLQSGSLKFCQITVTNIDLQLYSLLPAFKHNCHQTGPPAQALPWHRAVLYFNGKLCLRTGRTDCGFTLYCRFSLYCLLFSSFHFPNDCLGFSFFQVCHGSFAAVLIWLPSARWTGLWPSIWPLALC